MEIQIIIQQPDGSFEDPIFVDAALSVDHDRESEVTRHPVEKGAPITDHVLPQPRVVRISGIVSNTPITDAQRARVTDFLVVDADGTIGTPRDSYYEHVFKRLDDLHENPRLCRIETRERTYDDMALQSLSVPRDPQTGDALMFTAQFTAVTFAQTKTAQVDAKYLRAQKKQNMGSKPAKDATTGDAQTPAAPSFDSHLKGGGGAIGKLIGNLGFGL